MGQVVAKEVQTHLAELARASQSLLSLFLPCLGLMSQTLQALHSDARLVPLLGVRQLPGGGLWC